MATPNAKLEMPRILGITAKHIQKAYLLNDRKQQRRINRYGKHCKDMLRAMVVLCPA